MLRKYVAIFALSAFTVNVAAISVHNATDHTANVHVSYSNWWFNHNYSVAPHSDFEYSSGMKEDTKVKVRIDLSSSNKDEDGKLHTFSFFKTSECDVSAKFGIYPVPTQSDKFLIQRIG